MHENLISGSIQKACDADSTTSSATVTRTISPGRSFEHHVTSQAQVSVGNVPLSPSRVPPSTSTAATTSSNEVPFALTYPPLYVTAPAAMHTHQGYLNNQHPGSQHQSHSGHQQLNQVQAEQHSTSTEASNSFSSNQELWQTQVNGQIFELRDQIRELKAQVEMLKLLLFY
ncbi:unnamed protein product [Protopolystoma xenopodis]|uniref:Uncharacterized protein n=1 Tax=Protopolystoma xenopodis TaxID=117903 RepID=A0A448X677_9PLAT|nr:unnamed protein product [Protopolystoma xenopodis]